jgi:hypothetical protein
MSVTLYLPEMGLPIERQAQALTTDTTRLDIRPTKVRLLSNHYREADEADITFNYDQCGLDPRYVRSAEVYVYLWDGDQQPQPSAEDFRFVGIVRDVAREFSASSKILTLKALDYTTLFLESKPFPQSRLPTFTDTLTSAYQKVCRFTGHYDLSDNGQSATIISSICDADSSVDAYDGIPRIPLVVWQDENNPIDVTQPLGESLPDRIAKIGQMQHQTGTDSWAVWVACCESVGLITFIRGNECIVTTGTEYWTADNPPLLVYGKNLLTLTERRDLGQVSARNVCVHSYNGLTGDTLESFFPPTDAPIAEKIKKKRVLPSSPKGKSSKAIISQDYEVIDCQYPIADQATLDAFAKAVWVDRVRKELSGTLTTREMVVGTVNDPEVSNSYFDLLNLQAGDNLNVQIEGDALDIIGSLPDAASQTEALTSAGYTSDVAAYIVKNLSSLTGAGALPSLFLAHEVEIDCELGNDGSDGSFNVKVDFVNTLDLSGSAVLQRQDGAPITGKDEPPMDDGSELAIVLAAYNASPNASPYGTTDAGTYAAELTAIQQANP